MMPRCLRRFLGRHSMLALGLGLVLIMSLAAMAAPLLAPYDPNMPHDAVFAPPSSEFWLGTDRLGRDIFSRLLYGGRVSLWVGFVAVGISTLIGVVLGLVSGYFRGWVDELIMRVVDVMLSFPSQIMVFAVVALLGIDVRNVILANVFIKWAWYARMIRTAVVQYRDCNFVQFSRCVGTPEWFILSRHLLPSITADLAVLATLDIGWAVINISTLSFLGLGVQAPIPEWGAMLNEAKHVLTTNPSQMLVPGIGIVILVTAFNLLGDALRDVFDPKEAA